ncbi:MAG: GNAT family N-acetyltransferase [Gemmatimonadaceae bacterium]
MNAITYVEKPAIAPDALNALFARAWPDARPRDLAAILSRSLTYMVAFAGDRLVGYVNVATDGGEHAFLLDPTVDPAFQRRGIGLELVRLATAAAARAGSTWLHVDFEPALEPFYRRAGFRSSMAGLIRLK